MSLTNYKLRSLREQIDAEAIEEAKKSKEETNDKGRVKTKKKQKDE